MAFLLFEKLWEIELSIRNNEFVKNIFLKVVFRANIFSFIDKLMIEIINKNIEIEMAEGNKKTPNLKIILSISLSFKKEFKNTFLL